MRRVQILVFNCAKKCKIYKFLLILLALLLFSCHKTTKFSEVITSGSISIDYGAGFLIDLQSHYHKNVKDPEYFIYFVCQSGSAYLGVIQITPIDSIHTKPVKLNELTKRITGVLSFRPNKDYDYQVEFVNCDSAYSTVIVEYRIDLHYNL